MLYKLSDELRQVVCYGKRPWQTDLVLVPWFESVIAKTNLMT
jgi:hypothetical protein